MTCISKVNMDDKRRESMDVEPGESFPDWSSRFAGFEMTSRKLEARGMMLENVDT